VHGPSNVGFLSGVTAISSNYPYTLALKSDGTVWGWGGDGAGTLGDGVAGFITFTESSPVPVQVHGVGNVGFLTGVTAIAAGTNVAFALKSDGSVFGWGYNASGEIGDGTTTDSNVPVNIGFNLYVSPDGVIAASGSADSSVVLKADGTVWFMGSGLATVPTLISISDVSSVADAGSFSIALKTDGTVWTWTGLNLPSQLSGVSNVTAIAGGYFHGLALESDGTVWAWGANNYGQLGDGSTTFSATPVQVTGLTDVGVIATGTEQSYAIKSDGTVWAWGFNNGGQLGINTNVGPDTCGVAACAKTPVQVHAIADAGFLSGIKAVGGGDFGAVALTADGTVIAWGTNFFGSLGDGTNADSYVPVAVSAINIGNQIASIAVGSAHALALKTDGTVWAWGGNFFGALGDGTTTNRNAPVQTTGLTDVKVVASGFTHSLAIKSNGTLWAWGLNPDGELGDGTTTDRHTPVRIFFIAPAPTLSTTNNIVVLSREAVNTAATATIYFTLADTLSSQLTMTFDPAFTGMDVSGASASTPTTPGCMTNFVATGANTFTADKSGCTGPVIISGVTVVNPPTPGPYLVSWVNDDPGYAMVAIVDSDQVTVNAQVSPTITFDLDAGIAAGETAAPYVVALGALTTGAVNHSDHTGVNSIFAQLDTNATSGALVTVLSANAALKSASVPGDTIPNVVGTMANGTANYGICVNTVTAPAAATGVFNPAAPYNAGTCDPSGSTNAVKTLSTGTPTSILTSAGAPLTTGTAEILVNAAISTSTPAHSDYTDTLTFVATGTF
jgi:alpha-tubulin suppressor-like RCC1 family protein